MSYLKYLRAAALTGVLIVPVAFAACGGGDDGGSSSNGDTTAGRAKGEEGVPDGAPFIDQNNLKFIPTKITANAGEKIYFKNSETAIHTVTIDSKNVSGNMRKGDIVTWTAPKAGTYKVTCDYHPQMKATITIE